jgi:anti-sigma B factor antagonist
MEDLMDRLLTCKMRRLSDAVVMGLSGDLDLTSVPSLWRYLETVPAGVCDVVVDLTDLRYVESSGIQALLEAHRLFTDTGHRFVLAAPRPNVQRILMIVHMHHLIPVFPSLAAALYKLIPERKGA